MKSRNISRGIIIISLLISFGSKAQLFNGTGGAITNNGQETYFNLLVSGLMPTQLDSTFGLEQIHLTINHPADEELYMYLQSPDGTRVELAMGTSSSGANFTNTCFDSRADTSVTLMNAPYTGTFRPIGFLGRFNNKQTGNGTWKLIVKDYLASVDSGSVISWGIKFGSSPSKPVKFTSSNLPIVIIKTGNQSITDADLIVSMGIINNGFGQRNDTSNFRNDYNQKAAIHLRGNTSKNFEKKSYAFETRDMTGTQQNVSILGMPSENNWILTASYADKTLIRNQMTYDLSRQMGHYAPRTQNVELVIDNEYQGIYELMEKPKHDNNRIDVSTLTSIENSYPSITGGYILKIDRSDVPGWFSLLGGNAQNNAHFYYEYDYPKDVDITIPQKNYIKYFMDTLETVINSPTFADPVHGYQKYIDVASFIDFFIINELSKNVDGYRLSTYLYKDNISKGGKLHIGPVWDYDIAWHNANYANASDPTGWEYLIANNDYPIPLWWSRFLQDSNFSNNLYCRWRDLRQGILSVNYLNNYIDAVANTLNEGQGRNFTQWPVLGTYVWPNPQPQFNASYTAEVNDLKNWIGNRIAWMDANINGVCDVGIHDMELSENSILPFPNPFVNELTIAYKVPENIASGVQAQVKIELLNVLGDLVQPIFEGNKSAGTYQENVVTKQLATGIYIVKLKINKHIFYQKIVKLEVQ